MYQVTGTQTLTSYTVPKLPGSYDAKLFKVTVAKEILLLLVFVMTCNKSGEVKYLIISYTQP